MSKANTNVELEDVKVVGSMVVVEQQEKEPYKTTIPQETQVEFQSVTEETVVNIELQGEKWPEIEEKQVEEEEK